MYALYINGVKIPGSETGNKKYLTQRAYHLQKVMNENLGIFHVAVRELPRKEVTP